jgi:hypothetical protein
MNNSISQSLSSLFSMCKHQRSSACAISAFESMRARPRHFCDTEQTFCYARLAKCLKIDTVGAQCKSVRASRLSVKRERSKRNRDSRSKTHPAAEQEQGQEVGECHRCPSPSKSTLAQRAQTFRNPTHESRKNPTATSTKVCE